MTSGAGSIDNRGLAVVLPAGGAALVLVAILAASSDLKEHLGLYLAVHAALLVLMLVGFRAVASGGTRAFRSALIVAAALRLVAAAAPPSLSDDVFRYVWDGQVQAAGHHPYKFAPSDPMRSELRDPVVYPRINHPEIPTIYPPLAELLFAGLAKAGLGVTGFKTALGLLDLGVVFALVRLLGALSLPRSRAILYAWNPLAIVETAGSGHVEPLGVVLLLLALVWLLEGKQTRAGAAFGAAIQAKLLPLLLVPTFVRRMKTGAVLLTIGVVLALNAPYAIRGPAFGAGVLAYAHRWEHGSVIFPAVRAFFERADLAPHLKGVIAWMQSRWGSADTRLWDLLYGAVWPEELARVAVFGLAVGWAVVQSFRPIDAAREARLVLGGAILLAPTLHPWYLLWVLPLAAAAPSRGWLLLGALVPLQYLAGPGEVSWTLRIAILGPPLAVMAGDALLLRFRR
jgi:alpha-1,6-mannosyltransferase